MHSNPETSKKQRMHTAILAMRLECKDIKSEIAAKDVEYNALREKIKGLLLCLEVFMPGTIKDLELDDEDLWSFEDDGR